MGLLELESLGREKIGRLERREAGPPGVCLATDLVTCAALEEVSVTSAPSPLVLPLPEGSGSRLVSEPMLSGVGTRIGSLPLGTLSGVLKELLN